MKGYLLPTIYKLYIIVYGMRMYAINCYFTKVICSLITNDLGLMSAKIFDVRRYINR